MVEFIGILLVCLLINAVDLISVLLFGAGIGLLGAVDYISQNRLTVNKLLLLILQAMSTIFISLSLLNEADVYFVFLVLAGMCLFYFLYNLKKANKISMIILLIGACLIIGFAFYNVLNIYRFVVFLIGLISYFGLLYFKKPCNI